MSIQNQNTYVGWITEGRQVRGGEKKCAYHVALDGSASPLFHLNQTDELEIPDISVGQFVSVEERAAQTVRPKAPPRIKLTIDAVGTNDKHRLLIWCGNSPATIKRLKDAKWIYSGRLHRWVKYDRKPEEFVGGWEGLGYVVELEDKR